MAMNFIQKEELAVDRYIESVLLHIKSFTFSIIKKGDSINLFIKLEGILNYSTRTQSDILLLP